MKHMDFFCASPASTAVCSSMDPRAIVHHSSRPISRSHLSSAEPKKILGTAPCISQLPYDPRPFSNFQKSRKSLAKTSEIRRKSSANIDDMASPPGSSRYLLSDSPAFENLSDLDSVKALVPAHQIRAPQTPGSENYDKSLSLKSSSTRSHSSETSSNSSSLCLKSSTTRSFSRHQVVELRVSIHCKGCEGKVRKHISRMEGVMSFSIDRESKKVTVIGDVTPLGVLTSISRVKNAQFWPSPASSSSSSTPKFELNKKFDQTSPSLLH